MGDILFLAHRVPFPPNRGDRIRSANLLRKLAQIAPVHVGCFAESGDDREGLAELEAISASHCVPVRSKPLVLAGVEAVMAGKPVSLTAFHSARLANWVRETISAHPVDAIVVFSSQMGQYIPDDFAGRVIVDLCDVDSAKFEGYAEAGQRVWLNAREGRLLAREEERLAIRADATLLISENEAALFRSRLQSLEKTNIRVIGNGIDAESFNPASVGPHDEIAQRAGAQFVFTGQMDYPPNESAALWAIDEWLPLVRETHPDAELHIVGRSPTTRLQSRADRPGVTIWGEVPDIKPFLAAATCVIAPLLIARGVQNKVLEAMAMAKPVLLSPEAATGINARDDIHWLLSAAEAKSMCDRASALLSDPVRAAEMGAAARNFVLENHAWEAMLSPLDELVGIPTGEGCRDAA